MTAFNGGEVPRGREDLAPPPDGLELFARVEGRTGQERAPLSGIEHPRGRAERLGRHRPA